MAVVVVMVVVVVSGNTSHSVRCFVHFTSTELPLLLSHLEAIDMIRCFATFDLILFLFFVGRGGGRCLGVGAPRDTMRWFLNSIGKKHEWMKWDVCLWHTYTLHLPSCTTKVGYIPNIYPYKKSVLCSVALDFLGQCLMLSNAGCSSIECIFNGVHRCPGNTPT